MSAPGRTLVTGPTSLPVTVDEIMAQCRIDADDEYDYLTGLLQAGTELVENWISKKLVTQTWDIFYEEFPDDDCIELPFGRPQSITAFEYTDQTGTLRSWTISGSDFISGGVTVAHLDTSKEPCEIELAVNQVWPQLVLKSVMPIRIRGIWGYTTIPAGIKHAIKLLVASWYENREAVVLGNTASAVGSELPLAVQHLLANHRISYV